VTFTLNPVEDASAVTSAEESSTTPPARANRHVLTSTSASTSRRWVRRSGAKGGEKAKKQRRLSPAWAYVRAVLTGVSLLALGFVGVLTVGSQLQGNRDQLVLYNNFREQLANAVAPVSAFTDEGIPVASGDPVALLKIPSLSVNVVVVEGTTSSDMMLGPGHRRDTVLPGQAGVSVIMGRQAAFGGPFGAISSLVPGTELTATTGQGIATYRIMDVRRAGDRAPDAPAAGQGRLVLVSATGTKYLPDSVIRVDAQLVSTSVDGTAFSNSVFDTGARIVTASTLPDAEKPMGNDTSQVYALVLWLQLFLLALLAFTWARERWGRWQAWTVGVPVLLAVGWAVSNQLTVLLPNLI
jgi:LPXTG-site transpeptidase (sortase) family protein